jgi:hypothetical protein
MLYRSTPSLSTYPAQTRIARRTGQALQQDLRTQVMDPRLRAYAGR